jgi:four helix bundle protein
MRDNNQSPFERLDVWRSALEFTKSVYKLTAEYPEFERLSLTNQTRRSAVSVVANIAEGSCRHGAKSFANFCQIAYGSLRECEALLIVGAEVGYLEAATLASARVELASVSRQLFRLTQSLQRAGPPGRREA